MIVGKHVLIDGAVLGTTARRKDLVERMAKDLVTFEAHASEADAIRSLYATRRYGMADIVMMVDDARQVAMQEIVAREMMEP